MPGSTDFWRSRQCVRAALMAFGLEYSPLLQRQALTTPAGGSTGTTTRGADLMTPPNRPRTRAYELLLVSGQNKYQGAVQSMINPVASRERAGHAQRTMR